MKFFMTIVFFLFVSISVTAERFRLPCRYVLTTWKENIWTGSQSDVKKKDAIDMRTLETVLLKDGEKISVIVKAHLTGKKDDMRPYSEVAVSADEFSKMLSIMDDTIRKQRTVRSRKNEEIELWKSPEGDLATRFIRRSTGSWYMELYVDGAIFVITLSNAETFLRRNKNMIKIK